MESILTSGGDVPSQASHEETWQQIAPMLDGAMEQLGQKDHDAVVLRFFENKNFAEVGAALGASEDAAKMRVNRAVQKLRKFFTKRGVALSGAAITGAISANSVQAAPIGLSAKILAASLAITPAIGITMITKILITGLTTTAITVGIYAVHLQNQIGLLQEQQASFGQQIAQLSIERNDATNQLAALRQENTQAQANELELLRLRNEVTQLRNGQNVLPQSSPLKTNSPPRSAAVSILVETKFVLFPADDVQALGLRWTTDTEGNRVSLLTDQQFKTLTEAMQGASDVSVVSTPRVVANNGQQAVIGVTRAHALFFPDGTNEMPRVTYTNIGTVLDVRPFYSTNTSIFTMSYSAKLNVMSGDPSQPDIQTIEATNRMDLSPGQTAVMEMKIPSGAWMPDETNSPAGLRSLLLFATPQVVDSRDFNKAP